MAEGCSKHVQHFIVNPYAHKRYAQAMPRHPLGIPKEFPMPFQSHAKVSKPCRHRDGLSIPLEFSLFPWDAGKIQQPLCWVSRALYSVCIFNTVLATGQYSYIKGPFF